MSTHDAFKVNYGSTDCPSKKWAYDPPRSLSKDPELEMYLRLDGLTLSQVLRSSPVLGALIRFNEWLETSFLTTERELRWDDSYQRELERAETEFRAAFPNWRRS